MNSIHRSIAAVVIWYNPTVEQVANTLELVNQLSTVWVIDNSLKSSISINSAVHKCNYCWMGANLGVATALNNGSNLALVSGSEYALLLDQDSVFNTSMLQKHIDCSYDLFMDQSVAVIATSAQLDINQPCLLPIEVKSAITSGSIIRLALWRDVGGFNDGLFIDQVDHDYCIRLRLRGFKVLVNSNVEMLHYVGNPVIKKILGLKISSTNHHWLRRYYQMRNSLYLRSWYPSESKPFVLYLRDFAEIIIGILILESDRVRKLFAMLIGVVDFFLNRMGSWYDIHKNYNVTE